MRIGLWPALLSFFIEFPLLSSQLPSKFLRLVCIYSCLFSLARSQNFYILWPSVWTADGDPEENVRKIIARLVSFHLSQLGLPERVSSFYPFFLLFFPYFLPSFGLGLTFSFRCPHSFFPSVWSSFPQLFFSLDGFGLPL